MKSKATKLNAIWMGIAENVNVVFGFVKAVALAAILSPCTLQASTVPVPEDGKSGINCGSVLEKCVGQRVNGCGSVSDGGNLDGKGSTKLNGASAQRVSTASSDGESMTEALTKPLNQETGDKECSQPVSPLLGLASSDKPFDHNPWESPLWWIGIAIIWLSCAVKAW